MSRVANTLSAIAFVWSGYILGKLFTGREQIERAVTEKAVFDNELEERSYIKI